MAILINEFHRLTLGCAQFGSRYGIASSENIPDNEVVKIIKTAYSVGVINLDTASVYGDSEEIIGSINIGPLNIITKLPPLPMNSISVERWVNEHVCKSLQRLRTNEIYGLLLHNPADLLSSRGSVLYCALSKLKNEGLIKFIGVSIYSPYELSDIWEKFEIDIVQAPYNIFDQRIEQSGWADKICDSGGQLHIRSIFLQGLLLMDSYKYPNYFNPWKNILNEWRLGCSSNNRTPLDVCVNFAMNSRAQKVVIGVQSLIECTQVLESWKNAKNGRYLGAMPCEDLKLIDPRQWSVRK